MWFFSIEICIPGQHSTLTLPPSQILALNSKDPNRPQKLKKKKKMFGHQMIILSKKYIGLFAYV